MSSKQPRVEDVMSDEFSSVNVDDRASKISKIFSEKRTYMVVVLDGEGRYVGAITERALLRPHLNLSGATAKSLAFKPPTVRPDDDILKCARLMYENNLKALPVVSNSEVVGIVTVKQIGMAVKEVLKKIKVREVMTADPLTVSEDDTIGKAISLMRDEGISRLPVVSSSGKLVGIVTLHDVIEKVLGPRERASRGELVGSKVRFLGNKVTSIATRPVITARPDETVYAALERMMERDVSCLVVVDGWKVVGILTVMDVIEPIVSIGSEKSYGISIQTSYKSMNVSPDDKERAIAMVTKFASRLSKVLGTGSLSLHFKEHREKHGDLHLVHCRARLTTDRFQASASGEGWGVVMAARSALEKIEREILTRRELARKYPYASELLRYIADIY